MDLVAPLVAPALSQKPAFVTYFVARGAPRPCYIPEGFDSLPCRRRGYKGTKVLSSYAEEPILYYLPETAGLQGRNFLLNP